MKQMISHPKITPPRSIGGNVRTKIVWRGFVLRILALLFLLILTLIGYFGYKLYRLQKNIQAETQSAQTDKNTEQKTPAPSFLETTKRLFQADKVALKGADHGRINILLLGMGGEGHQGEYLTDTIMLVSINPENYQSAMLSIPRDLYVQIPDTKFKTKINAIYAYCLQNEQLSQATALDAIKETVQSVSGQRVDYYLAMDFDGFKQIINELGGIDLEVTEDIHDEHYPGPNYSYQTFEIAKGFQHLNADTALKYARVRHTPGGDFGRAARQQQVIAAAKKKAFSLGTIANPLKIGALMDILGHHIKTDIQLEEIPAFIKLAERVNVYNTTGQVLDAWETDSLLASSHVPMGGVMAYVLLPRAKNYSQIHDLAENIFDLKQIEMKKEQVTKEDARIAIIRNSTQPYYKIRNSFQRLGYQVQIQSPDPEKPYCHGEDKIISLTQTPKLFTLDDLTAKLNILVSYQPVQPINENEKNETGKNPDKSEANENDILICFSGQTARYFQEQNETKEEEKFQEQSIVTREGKILTGE